MGLSYGREYLLYSFGLDCTDDGGRTPEEKDRDDGYYTLLRKPKYATGYDFVINMPYEHPIFDVQ